MIGKYPPIEGGVSAETYWMCRALAERGHDVVVVTNAAEADDDYRMELGPDDLGELNKRFANGGRLRVSWTGLWSERDWHHVPTGNPTHTRLVSLALQAVAEQRSELILSHYLEPYGVAAATVGSLTGLPWVARHAGSDRFRLINNPELGTLYKATLRHANGVMFSGSDLLGLGVEPERVIEMPARNFIPPSFSEDSSPMDLVAAFDSEPARSSSRFICPGPLDPYKPIIGMYGKVGEEKGTFDLLRAYATSPFLQNATQLVFLGGGANRPRVREAISKLGLSGSVWLHPFVAHWQVPAFLRSCRVVCLLERAFDVVQHGPGLLKETLACAVPTLVSAEVYAKNLPSLDKRQVEELVRVIPAGASADDLASTLDASLSAHDRASATTRANHHAERAQLSRDFDDLSDELVSRFSAVKPHSTRRYSRSADSAKGPIMEMIGAVAPTLARKYRGELDQLVSENLVALPTDSPSIAAVLPAVEAIVARESVADEHELAVMRLEADLLWGAIEPVEAEFSEAFPADAGTISRLSIQSPAFSRHQDILRRCWVRSARLRFRELPTSILSYLDKRRNRVDTATRAPYEDGRASQMHNTRSFLIAQRAELDALVIQVSDAVRGLLNCCDGEGTAEDMVDILRQDHPAVTPSVVVEWLQNLQELGIVRESWTYEHWQEEAPYLTRGD